ncbi:MAG: potassium transporter TrkG [Fuerstiella sp.]
MPDDASPDIPLSQRLAQHKRSRMLVRLRRVEMTVLVVGIVAVLIHAGFIGVSSQRTQELTFVVIAAMAWLAISRLTRFLVSVSKARVFRTALEMRLAVPGIWVIGVVALSLSGQIAGAGWARQVVWTEIMMAVSATLSALAACRRLATRTDNSAVMLVGSFLVMITVGTLLLKLPVCRAVPANASAPRNVDWDVALFTATSASCVTGLIVEPTGSYWSPLGHAIIFALFQVGGLGILTFGAFVAVLSGRRGLQFREARTLGDMLDADSVQSSRRLLLTILLFTVIVEAAGAGLLIGLWAELPLPQRIWQAVFHSVSAFCNAGFSLQDDGFLGMGTHWQVWGPVTVLIIMGGLGFSVVHDLWAWCRKRFRNREATPLFRKAGLRPRLSLHTRLVLWSGAGLLAAGAVLWFLLESLEAPADSSVLKRLADAWFQSVTFRTAGFNTVDHAGMNPATKLLAVFLMFIGAAPGSTGGGVKTVVFAITVLNIRAVFRGHDRVEVFGRLVPVSQVSRALSMIAIGIFIVMGTTALLVVFERQPERFLDHLYEATSAFGTVGVSAGVTADLSLPSRLLICVVMFLGRVGPITMLLAMASPVESTRYDYPEERVSLG